MKDKQATGKLGEELALLYLQKKGLTFLEANYRYRRSEIDLIMQDGGELVFIEVKTRSGPAEFGYPEQAVDNHKINMVQQGAEQYQLAANYNGPIRFDIVSVALSNGQAQITHFTDAF